MEGYLFTGKIIQDSHMKQPQQLPRYVKKYDLQNSSIRFTDLYYHIYTLSNTITQKDKDKNKNHKQLKLAQDNKNHKINGLINFDFKSPRKVNAIKTDISQFFVKKSIHPKSTRQLSHRSLALFKSHNPSTGDFYDVKINVIKKKSRNCIILPQRKQKKQQPQTINSNQKHKQIIKKARQWVEQQWQQQRKRRNAQCKTACQFYRQKSQAILTLQAKKIQQEIKSKEFEQRIYKTQNKTQRYYVSQQKQNWKKTQPLAKEQMKQLCTTIMKKYKVDSSAYSESVRKIL